MLENQTQAFSSPPETTIHQSSNDLKLLQTGLSDILHIIFHLIKIITGPGRKRPKFEGEGGIILSRPCFDLNL